MNIKLNDFTKRQTPESKYGHFDGSWEELELLTTVHFENQKPGYRDGVVLVIVPTDKFYTSIIEINENTVVESQFEARQEGEIPYLSMVAKNGEKMPAKHVEIVCYSHEVLAEKKEFSYISSDWEIVSINCSPWKCGVPMAPMTRARNNLNLKGGTDSKYQELGREDLIQLVRNMSEEIVFWNTHLMLGD